MKKQNQNNFKNVLKRLKKLNIYDEHIAFLTNNKRICTYAIERTKL